MKKLLAVLLALAMLFSFAACGKDTPDKPDTTKQPSANSDAAIEASLFTVDFGGDWINIEDEFKNELLSQAVRFELYEQTKDVRKLIAMRALATTIVGEAKEVIEPPKTYTEDEILKDWFENENS